MAAVRHFEAISQKFRLPLISTSTCKIWWRSDDPLPTYRVFSMSKWRTSAIFEFIFSQYFVKNSN